MRRIVRSRTYVRQFQGLLDYGALAFGSRVANTKLARVDRVLEHLAHFPATGTPDARLGLLAYPISQTPFVVIYDFDDDELHIHFIIHGRADRSVLDPKDVDW